MLYLLDRLILKQIAFGENGKDVFCWERKKRILPGEIGYQGKLFINLIKDCKKQI